MSARTAREDDVSARPAAAGDRRRPAVLRTMEEVPREVFVAAGRPRSMPIATARSASPAVKPSASPSWWPTCRRPHPSRSPPARPHPHRPTHPSMKESDHGDPRGPRSLPEHPYPQEEITDAFARVIATAAGWTSGCSAGSTPTPGSGRGTLVLPLEEYGELDDFGDANDLSSSTRSSWARGRCRTRSRRPTSPRTDVDLIVSATVTGLAVPSLDARIAALIGLRPTSSGCRWSGSAASPARPGSPGCTTTCSATPTRSPCWSRRALLADRAARRRLDAQPGRQRALR